jgi:ABC-type uncharacterized transport system substrate-binding protein
VLSACDRAAHSDGSQKALAGKEVLLFQQERLPNLEQLEKEILARPALAGVKVQRVTLPFAEGPLLDQRVAEELAKTRADLVYTQTPATYWSVAKLNTKRIPTVFLTVLSLRDTQVVDDRGERLPGLEHVTGLAVYAPAHAKYLEAMQDAFPGMRKVGIMVDNFFNKDALVQVLKDFPDITPVLVEVKQEDSVERLAERVRATGADAWYFPQSTYLQQNSQALVGAMRRMRIRGMYGWHICARQGGTLSMQAAIPDRDKRHAEQIELILSGTKPSEIAIETASTLRVSVNAKAIEELGNGFNRNFIKFVDVIY